MLNFKLFVKVMWIKKLVTGNQKVKWKRYFRFLMRPFGGILIFYCNYLPKMIDVQLPKYYQDLLNIWLDMKEFIKKDTIHKGNEIFFSNRFIYNNGYLFLKKTYRLYHIIDGKRTLKSDTFFRCMGQEEEEITMLKEIYGNIPEEWKIELTKRQASFQDLKIEFKFTEKTFQFESVCSKNLYRACVKKIPDLQACQF